MKTNLYVDDLFIYLLLMQIHVVSREIWLFAMLIMRFLPLGLVDALILLLCYLKFGDLSKYGIHRPSKGPLYLKKYTPKYPVIDIGTVKKIKSGEIQVYYTTYLLFKLVYTRGN